MYVHVALTHVCCRACAHDCSRSRYAIIIIAANNGPVIGALHAFLVLLFGSFASFGQVTPFASAFSLSFSLPSPPPRPLLSPFLFFSHAQLQFSSRVCTRLQQQSAISNSRGLQKGIRQGEEERVGGGGGRAGEETAVRVGKGSRKSQK